MGVYAGLLATVSSIDVSRTIPERGLSPLAKLKKPITLETAFGTYTLGEVLGEGGAGKVYGGAGPDGAQVAVKILSTDRVTTDKRRRFRNETAFLAKNRHPNIVSVIDYGVAEERGTTVPFYVMKRYDTNFRDRMRAGLPPENALGAYAKILDGVEAAHLQGAVHRDLKPENILLDGGDTPAVADFGVASFTADVVATTVETGPTQRLANFMYAAPEQRVPGREVGVPADIYALGLILNEMFTGDVPHGTEYTLIAKRHPEFAFLDDVVARMIRHAPNERYASIAEVKGAISIQRAEFLTRQKLSEITATVIPEGEVDDPLAHEPPKLIDFDWKNGTLELKLDRPVHGAWVQALHNMGNFTMLPGIMEPHSVHFSGDTARANVPANSVQDSINVFKGWLPTASRALLVRLTEEARRRERELQEKLRREKAAEERRLKLLQTVKI